MTPILESLRGGLIVSIQPPAGTPLRVPTIIAAMAQVAVAAGAVGVRIESSADIAAVRAAVCVPIIGLIKRREPGYEPYITPCVSDVETVIAAGADIVAFDATLRARPELLEAIIAAIAQRGCVPMADCSDELDAQNAQRLGCAIIATTLFGYTENTRGLSLPALALCENIASLGAFVICEGGIATPDSLRNAYRAGADAMVVGTALTDVGARVGEFAAALAKEKRR